MSAAKIALYAIFFFAVFFGLLYLRFGSSTVPFLVSLVSEIVPGGQVPVAYQVTSSNSNQNSNQGANPQNPAGAGNHPLLFDNMRWAKMPIPIFVDNSSCTPEVSANLQLAADEWSNDTGGAVSFSLAGSRSDGKVYVICESELKPQQKEGTRIVETLGEARPTVINTGLYNLTVSADVAFVPNSGRCTQDQDRPIVYLHELGHVLGLGHDNETDSIMFAFERCDQVITPGLVSTVQRLYADPALPDLYVTNVSATRHGFYADFNLSVYNRGLIPASPTKAAIYDNTEQIYSLNVPSLNPGSGWFFTLSNIPVTTIFENVSIVVDPKSEISELNKQNNAVFLVRQ